jgi:hypothetical protein
MPGSETVHPTEQISGSYSRFIFRGRVLIVKDYILPADRFLILMIRLIALYTLQVQIISGARNVRSKTEIKSKTVLQFRSIQQPHLPAVKINTELPS